MIDFPLFLPYIWRGIIFRCDSGFSNRTKHYRLTLLCSIEYENVPILCSIDCWNLQNKTFSASKNCKIRRFTCTCQKNVVPLQLSFRSENKVWIQQNWTIWITVINNIIGDIGFDRIHSWSTICSREQTLSKSSVILKPEPASQKIIISFALIALAPGNGRI